MRVVVGKSMCDRRSGKKTRSGSLCGAASERRILWAELEPWGAAGLMGCVAEHAGPQLKRRSEGCSSEQQSPLSSYSSAPLFYSTHLRFLGFFSFSLRILLINKVTNNCGGDLQHIRAVKKRQCQVKYLGFPQSAGHRFGNQEWE